MKKNCEGHNIIEEDVLFLVDYDKKIFKKLGKITVDEGDEFSRCHLMIPFAEILSEKLKSGLVLFCADELDGGKYDATWRILYPSFAKEMNKVEVDIPLYFDSAEDVDCLLFSHIVNGEPLITDGGHRIEMKLERH